MIDIPAYHYKLKDGIWHLWDWTRPLENDMKFTDCGIPLENIIESRLSGVNGVDLFTLCRKCFASHIKNL